MFSSGRKYSYLVLCPQKVIVRNICTWHNNTAVFLHTIYNIYTKQKNIKTLNVWQISGDGRLKTGLTVWLWLKLSRNALPKVWTKYLSEQSMLVQSLPWYSQSSPLVLKFIKLVWIVTYIFQMSAKFVQYDLKLSKHLRCLVIKQR
jgi:hypothetical protein